MLPPVDALPTLEQLWSRAAQTGAGVSRSDARTMQDMRDTCDMHDTRGPYDMLVQTCAALRTHAETISSKVGACYFSHASLTGGEIRA